MSGYRSLWLLIITAVASYWLTGCGLFHEYRPMRVMVRDAATKQPIPGADIEGWYSTMLDVFGPERPHGITDSDGVATLWIGPDRGFRLRVDEPGYPMTDDDETHLYFHSLPKKGSQGDDPKRIDRVIELQPESKPTFVIVMPKGYRGLVRVRFEPTEDIPVPPGRIYTIPADQDGRAVVRLPKAVCRTDKERDIAARESDGKKVPWDGRCPESAKVALRHLGSTEDTELRLIGTGSEAEAIYARILRRNADGNSELDRAAYDKLFAESRASDR